MRVLVCGGRNYRNWKRLAAVLDEINTSKGISCIIHGNASGADRLAGMWAVERDVKVRVFVARWDLEGRAAGVIRNQVMLEKGKPDLVVAFPGGRGTEDMIQRARAAGVKTRVFRRSH